MDLIVNSHILFICKVTTPLTPSTFSEGNRFRALMYDITQHLYFKRFIVILVITNCLMLSTPVSFAEFDVLSLNGNLNENCLFYFQIKLRNLIH